MRPLARALVGLVASALALPAPALADPARHPLDKQTFFEMESVSNPRVSPDGSTIVFSRGFVDVPKDQNQSNLWVIDVRGGRLRQLADGAWRDSEPTWSPDGKRIAFLSNRSGTTQVHVLWVDTRETLQLTRVEREPRDIEWSPDEKRIAFVSNLPDETPVLGVRLPKTPGRGAAGGTGAGRTFRGVPRVHGGRRSQLRHRTSTA